MHGHSRERYDLRIGPMDLSIHQRGDSRATCIPTSICVVNSKIFYATTRLLEKPDMAGPESCQSQYTMTPC